MSGENARKNAALSGLGNINNNYGGHEAGSAAVRAYFLAVATALRHQGEAYAIAGDEAIALAFG
jgi:hypothetical protein